MSEKDNLSGRNDLTIGLPANSRFYVAESDPFLEEEIVRYVEAQARGESVKHVEKLKDVIVVGERHEVWDVVTNRRRWWVLTNLTNLYSQKHFPSLDYTISFHVGLMMRLRSRPEGADRDDPTPFDDVFRRQEQAKERFDRAVESEDYQAIGMCLRECILSLTTALRRRLKSDGEFRDLKDSDVVGWTEVLADRLCPGEPNKVLRQYLKATAKHTWHLVNWITHHRNANKTASSIAIHACDTTVGHFVQLLEKEQTDHLDTCPLCKSRSIRTHFDPLLADDGGYFLSCAECRWDNHPGPPPTNVQQEVTGP